MRRTRRRDDGAAAVEFALVAPVLFALLLGIIVFGFALFAQQAAVHAAREGARAGAIGIPDKGSHNATCSAFSALVKDKASGITLTKVDVGFGDDGKAGQAGNVVYGTLWVKTEYTVDLSPIAWLPAIPNKLNLAQVAKAAIEQPSPANIGTGCP